MSKVEQRNISVSDFDTKIDIYSKYFYEECAKHNITGWIITFNALGLRTVALTCYDGQVVEFSKYYVAVADEHTLKQTILHEIAHILDPADTGPQNQRHHGPEWKKQCKIVGYTGDMFYRGPPLRAKWLGKCTNCGQKLTRHKLHPKTKIKQCCGKNLIWKERFKSRNSLMDFLQYKSDY